MVRVDADSEPVHEIGTGPESGRLRIGGWAISGAEPPSQEVSPTRAQVRNSDGLVGTVVALHGPLHAAVRASTGRTSHAEHAAVPYLETPAPARPGDLHIAAIALGHAPGEPPTVSLPDPATVQISWPDGHTDLLQLADRRRPPLPTCG